MPFSQFAVDAETVFNVMDELNVPPNQLKDFKENKDGCVIGAKLASDRRLKVGDPMPLKGDTYPVDMNLTVRGIYSGPPGPTSGCACSTSITSTRRSRR